MSATVYECMHILDSNRYARDPSGVQESVDSTVTKFDGEILVSRLWNEQKLAYLVDGHRKGTYWLSYIRIEGSRLVEMERAFQLNENVLRTLTLRLDERLVEPMVAHARGEAVPNTLGDDDAASDAGDQSDANSSKETDKSAETTESVEQPVAEEASSES
ncbi:MAG: 30S ribosomal protein S6 [Pirellulaceae bacterium]